MALVEEVVKAMHLSSEEEMEGLRQVTHVLKDPTSSNLSTAPRIGEGPGLETQAGKAKRSLRLMGYTCV